ncbi:LuxR family transcriptional regulator [Burkholderia ubonensis]|uniref:LuxR family transcriptional regulator n=1 Tax=Burkholderia ubonensis TaxID=101571 RepID=UPI000AADA3C0|nr:LuxR family transcriptional regulator [Burkholderia ubonensis]
MEFNRLFAHVGEAISSSGSRRFPRMLYRLISAAVPVDEIRISALAADGAPRGDLEVRSLGAVGAALAQAGPPAAAYGPPMPPRPDPSRLHVDDTLAGHGPPHALLDRFFLAQAAIVPLRGAQFPLATRKGGHYYLISLYRTNTFDDFAPQERTFLKELSHVLFPIAESHVAALDAAPPAARPAAAAPPRNPAGNAWRGGSPTACGRPASSCRRARSRHARREACTALLAGDTVPAIAGRFALRESTVEIYLKRAAVKLGFGGRHGLTHWMPDETAGAEAATGSAKACGGTSSARRGCASPRIGT